MEHLPRKDAWKMDKAKFWLLSVSSLLIACPQAWSDPPLEIADELVNPVAPPAVVERLELPAERPEIEQTSYWRSAKTPNQTPPNPTDIAQPAWLLPEPVVLEKRNPVEPTGPAVFVDDTSTNETETTKPTETPKSAQEVIELAMAKVEVVPSRSAALLVVARELAVEAKSVGDFGDVIDQCHRALDADADQRTAVALAKLGAWAYNRRGELLIERGNEHDAFDNFQEAVLLDNQCWQALHNRGVTLARYAKNNEALNDFDCVVALAPEFAVARYNRAEVLSQLGRWQQAVDDYNVAVEALPAEADLYVGRGLALTQLGKTTEAVNDFNAALKLNPMSSEAYLARGNMYASQRLYEQAAADFENALRLNPRSAATYQSTAWLLATCPLDSFRSGPQAVEAAKRLAKLRGTESPKVLDTLAVAYAAAGDFAQAITYQEQAIVLATDEQDTQDYQQRLAKYRQHQPYLAE